MAFIKCINQIEGGASTVLGVVLANVNNSSYSHYSATAFSGRCVINDSAIAIDTNNRIGYLYIDLDTPTPAGKSGDWQTFIKHTIPSANRPVTATCLFYDASMGDTITLKFENDYIYLPSGSITQANGNYIVYSVWKY